MKTDSLKVFSPATIANLSCGFDILGLALENPGDEVVVKRNNTGTLRIENKTPYKLPLEPEKNVTTVALQAMLGEMKSKQGFDIVFERKIHPGSGIGSSSASSAAGVFGANELFGKPFTRKELVAFAMQGEKAASGSAHADNVAPALLGGITLICGYNPLDVHQIPVPEGLFTAVVTPEIEVKTSDARRILRSTVALKDAIAQWGNVAGLVTGFFKSDFGLISRSLKDVIVEPVRSILIPGFYDVKEAALKAGALGSSISGAGPSIFALTDSKEKADAVAAAMKSVFDSIHIHCASYVGKVNATGAKII